jgi:hypothetical protein
MFVHQAASHQASYCDRLNLSIIIETIGETRAFKYAKPSILMKYEHIKAHAHRRLLEHDVEEMGYIQSAELSLFTFCFSGL